jgi:purine nucleosidase
MILDCDPGHDDAIAILLAHGSPAVELLAITTVAGNQTLPKVTRNALQVCTVAGIHDVPVAAGCSRPIMRDQITAPMIHGESGLDGPHLPEPSVRLDPRHAVQLIIDVIMSNPPHEVSLVPVGPLTNIATAMRLEPQIVPRVREVVLMGGSYTRGNFTPAAEFNILADPEASAAVFSAEWPVTMVGLDVTHQARATEDVVGRIEEISTPLATLVVGWLRFFGSTYKSVEGMVGAPVHDPCAVARVIDPSIVGTTEAFVAVETQGHWTAGMTVTDFRQTLGKPANTLVATSIDVQGFWQLVFDAVRRIGTPWRPEE